MELWIPITIAAAFLQNLRSALQKHLTGRLSTTGATFIRFGFGVPFALLYLAILVVGLGLPLPTPNLAFALFAMVGGIAQIAGTALLLHAFSFRNFAVGTTFSKTETVQTALFGIIVLGDPLTLGPALGILISFIGVILLTTAKAPTSPGEVVTSFTSPAALSGMGSGLGFGIAAVCYRAASLSLGGEGFLVQAAFALTVVIILQSLILVIYLWLFEPGQLGEVARAWRPATLVGLAGMSASAGWFTAMTIQNAAHVRALGQVELVFTFAASQLVFGERSNLLEISGIVLVIGGILVLLLL